MVSIHGLSECGRKDGVYKNLRSECQHRLQATPEADVDIQVYQIDGESLYGKT